MVYPDFAIQSQGPIAAAFLQRGINRFGQAASFMKQLPYGRNADKANLLTVFDDGCATCSTKHALLQTLANENGYEGLQLMLGIYTMNASNTPKVAKVLERYGLTYLPEAHNYLRWDRQIIDCTSSGSFDFEKDLLEETAIKPEQITDFKVAYHKAFLQQWLAQNAQLPYTLEQLWDIREQCILALSG